MATGKSAEAILQAVLDVTYTGAGSTGKAAEGIFQAIYDETNEVLSCDAESDATYVRLSCDAEG